MRNFKIYLVLLFTLGTGFARAEVYTVRDPAEFRATQLAQNTHKIVFDFKALPVQLFATDEEREQIYQRNYPHGDFYYFIGGLSDSWTKDDYSRFYKVAKKLSEKGFRTIVNVRSMAADVEEAVANVHTSAIIWNSHGSIDGVVYDSEMQALPRNVFNQNRTERLRLVIMANCYGAASKRTYGLSDERMTVVGWSGEVDSDKFFRYLNSKKFEEALPLD